MITSVIGATSALASTINGPDVSHWDHVDGKAITWTQVAASGQRFAFVKATESTTYVNSYYAGDVVGAKAAGLVVGSYHFARPAMPLSTATAQAKYFLATTGSLRTRSTLPPVLDLEVTGGLSKTNLVAWASTWLSTVQSLSGRVPMVYASPSFITGPLGNSTALSRYYLWLAKWSTVAPTVASLPGGWTTWTFWQYTDAAKVAGIPATAVDSSQFNGSTSQLATLADGTDGLAVPTAPLNLTAATNSNGTTTVTWTPPSDSGGAPITAYQWTVDGVAQTQVTVGTSGTVISLDPTQPHVFTVAATNAVGTSAKASMTLEADGTIDQGVAPSASTTVGIAATRNTVTAPVGITTTVRRSGGTHGVSGAHVTVSFYVSSGTRPAPINLVANGSGTATTSVAIPSNATIYVAYAGAAGLAVSQAKLYSGAYPTLTAKLSATIAAVRHPVTLSGKTSTRLAGAIVYRQGYYNKAWHSWASTRVSATGTYAFVITPTVATTDIYRVYVVGNSWHYASGSASVRLRVT